ncbi:MAG TPA: HAMP domain-containing sensor histidine kinase [Acidimicrobiia bacterium]|nr:HAMP domain-containing sensor histidine kinase [Acidimicrobiia bacterium]
MRLRRSGPRSLRRQVLVTFALGSVLLAGLVSLVTYGASRSYLFRQRRTYATRQASANARLMDNLSRAEPNAIPELLGSLETPAGSVPMLFQGGRWYVPPRGPDERLIPADVRNDVINGGHERDESFNSAGAKLAVGIPLRTGDAYFEIFPLHELARTLGAVRLALIVAGLLTLIGSLALGSVALRKILAPVLGIGRTAKAIAEGDRGQRLEVADYDELADLAGTFNRMVDSLNAQIERDARFASNVSHELRSPLTTLKSAVEGMRRRAGHLDERSGRLLTLLVEEVNRFEGMVTDLLEISRMDASRQGALRRQELTVDELVATMTGRPGGLPQAPVVIGHRQTMVRVDPRRVERIVANLVRNAETHGRGLTGLRVVMADGSVRIEVEDRGSGVPIEERERIFERFYRRSREAGERGRGDGVGLGLALVAEHVRLHDGRVWVEDASGGGARFVVELPAGVAPGRRAGPDRHAVVRE